MGTVDETTPLLPTVSQRFGGASARKTYGNIIISILGSGVLGLPFTYKVSGWAVATVAILLAGSLAYYCMMLLVSCREKLANNDHVTIRTYPDLGYHLYGNLGGRAVEVALLISQVGCCVAYLIFIAHNLSSIFFPTSRYMLLVLLLMPFEVLVSWIRSLSTLAPFSIFASLCNVLAMAIVIKDDVARFSGFSEMKPFTDWRGLPFALGICIYCYEGFGMTLTLHSSMRKPQKFGQVLALAFLFITAVYIVFGFAGYAAFGDKTKDIITLNLDNSDWSTKIVKLGLSIALFFTFPVMMYPVYEIIEGRLILSQWFQKHVMASPRLETLVVSAARGMVVIGVGLIAVAVPGFGTFISLVGSTVCALLAFVFPALLHWKTCGEGEKIWRFMDGALVLVGVVFAGYGTFQACKDIFRFS